MSEQIVINDANYGDFLDPIVDGEVMQCSSWGMSPLGVLPHGTAFEDQQIIPLIPENEWDPILEMRQDSGTTTEQLLEDMHVPCLSQGQSNYCWAFGSCLSAIICRLRESGQYVPLSPTSAAYRIKGGANRGGWGVEFLDHILTYGCNTQDEWPLNELQRQYDTPGSRLSALRHRAIEYIKLDTYEQLGSALIAGYGVGCGFNWWRHLVCGTDILPGSHDLRIRNSWGPNWGKNGFGTLSGNKKWFDGQAVAIVSMMAL